MTLMVKCVSDVFLSCAMQFLYWTASITRELLFFSTRVSIQSFNQTRYIPIVTSETVTLGFWTILRSAGETHKTTPVNHYAFIKMNIWIIYLKSKN